MENLSWELLSVFGTLSMAAVLFATNCLRSDLVAILVILALILSGVLTVDEALAGFSEPVVLVIAVMFIIGEALLHTGITQSMGRAVVRASRGIERRVVVFLMLVISGIGAFMSSTAVVALFIPMVLAIEREAKLNRKRLLMPVAFAALISGMMTLIGTAPNLIVNTALKEKGLAQLTFFSFTPIGVTILLAGICYILLFGRRMLSREKRAKTERQYYTIEDLVNIYGIKDKILRLCVLPESPLSGRTVAFCRINELYGIKLIGFEKNERGRRVFYPAGPDLVFEAGDSIYLLGDRESALRFMAAEQLSILPGLGEHGRRQAIQEVGFAEVMLPPGSPLIGRTLEEAEFRSHYRVSVLAVRRRGKPVLSNLRKLTIDFGDVLLVSGSWSHILNLRLERESFILLTLPYEYQTIAPARQRAPMALTILVAMVVSIALGLLPMTTAVIMAAVALIATHCVRLDAVYQVVSWQTVVLIAGILPLATALNKTGAADLLAAGVIRAIGDMGPFGMLAAIFLLTSITGLFISNSATAIIIAPVAIDVAQAIGVSPQAFAMTVAIACSAAYVTPVSSPVNTLVMDPGGYSFMDFVKVGIPLLLLTLIFTVILAWFMYMR